MKAMIMAAGVGTRLRPLTCAIPKPMVPVINLPVLEHVFNLLKRHNIFEVVVNLHFQPHMVREYFEDGSKFGMKITYSPEEILMGTAGGVKKVERYFDDTFLVMSGDGISNVDLTAAVNFHKQRQALATIVLKSVEYPLEYGVVITEKDGRITRFLEKPAWGEVFSNTANTGIYVFEPAIFEEMPYGENYDFGHQLFPKLLQKKAPIYGFVTDDYWCDIGDLLEYRQTHYSVLKGEVGVAMPGNEVSPGIWVGHGSQIHPEAKLEAPLLIGNNCVIEKGARLTDGTTIGHDCFIGQGTSIKRGVIWDKCYISQYNELRGCVLAKNVSTESNVTIFEGAIVAENCIIGENCIIQPNVKVWPNKVVEMGTALSTSFIWGERWRKNIFGSYGVSGRTNVEITPEFATKLSSAFGSYLPKGSNIIVAASDNHLCRVFKRIIEGGLITVGVNVVDADALPAAVVRYGVRSLGISGGIYVKTTPGRQHSLTMEFYDSRGLDLDRATQKKVETLFFREDFRRAYGTELGTITSAGNLVEKYSQAFLDSLNGEIIARRPLKVVVNFLGEGIHPLLRETLGKLPLEIVLLNEKVTDSRDADGLRQEISKIVLDMNAHFGVLLDLDNESLEFLDEKGMLLANEKVLLALCFLQMKYTNSGSIVVPVNASRIIENLAKQFFRAVVWTKTSRESLMRDSAKKGVIIAGNDQGNIIFPEFPATFDITFALAKTIELVAQERKTFSQLMEFIPAHYIAKETVECPWEIKGEVMRSLIERTDANKLDLIDGVKINDGKQKWVLILPDSEQPALHIYAEGPSQKKANQMVAQMKESLFSVRPKKA